MPANIHNVSQPQNIRIKVWRYLTFSKYVSMLESSSLYFCRLDRLSDPFEGKLAVERDIVDRPGFSESEILLSTLSSRVTFVNCWHMSEYENDAMWKLYARDGEGVCIQSSYERLGLVLNSDIRLGCVNYRQTLHPDQKIDFSKDHWFFATTKRASFEHEREVRAILGGTPQCGTEEEIDSDEGRQVDIDLRRLIESVLVYPFSETWFLNLVKAVTERFGHTFPVRRSEMETIISRR